MSPVNPPSDSGPLSLDYRYSALPREPKSFRLLRLENDRGTILYDLATYSLQGAPGYDAISYRWGPPEPQRPILIGQTTMLIPQGVYEMIRSLAPQPGRRYLWLDYVCINQKDEDDEKEYQIPLMRDVYSRAEHVIAYLGAAPENDVALIQGLLNALTQVTAMMRMMAAFGLPPIPPRGIFQENLEGTRALQRLLSNEYWARAWVIQELAMGREVNIKYGGFGIDWDAFETLIRGSKTIVDGRLLFLQDNWADAQLRLASQKGMNAVGNILWIKRRLREHSEEGLHIADIVLLSAQAKATQAPDMVYALLGLSAQAGSDLLRPNYKLETRRIYARAVEQSLRDGKFCLLNLAGLCRARTESLQLPSWVPDLTQPPMVMPLDSLESLYTAGGLAQHGVDPSVSDPESPWDEWEDCDEWESEPDTPVFEIGSEPSEDENIRLSSRGNDGVLSQLTTGELGTSNSRDGANGPAESTPSPDNNEVVVGPPATFEILNDETQLKVRGLLIDHIEAVSTMQEVASEHAQVGLELMGNNLPALMDFTMERHIEIEQIVSSHVPADYFNGQSREESLWRTLIGDENHNGECWRFPADDEFRAHYVHFRDFFSMMEQMKRRPDLANQIVTAEMQQSLPDQASMGRFFCMMGRKAMTRRFAVTKQGYMGLVMGGVEKGDYVCVFPGSKTPYVLRKCRESDTYQLMCEAYLHGFMGGEAFESEVVRDRFSPEYFTIV